MQYVATDSVFPNEYQPRKHFDPDNLRSLSDSISELGVLQPILVRPSTGGSYELIAGERRWRAAKMAGLKEIPVLVREVDDQESLEHAIVENLHRADLNPLEEGAGYQRLIEEFSLSIDEVATKVGKSRPAVANTLRLFQLPVQVQGQVAAGLLGAGHARALLGLKTSRLQSEVADQAVTEGLSVRKVEALVKSLLSKDLGIGEQAAVQRPSPTSLASLTSAPLPPSALLEVEQLLSDRLSTRVKATIASSGGPGRLVIEFADLDDLDRIFEELS